ncbi:hypothetical protein [Dapis sp. BLCC M229]|uniref:hypothetical protein n=1 Tax=Dapis sp. BLCC M229 TaxID=3400188 RepID=UPI003CF55B41
MKKQLLTISTILIIILLGIILTITLLFQQSLTADLKELKELFEIQLQRSYTQAVEDAADAKEDEIYNKLWSITSDNPDLIWREIDGKPQVIDGNLDFLEWL